MVPNSVQFNIVVKVVFQMGWGAAPTRGREGHKKKFSGMLPPNIESSNPLLSDSDWCRFNFHCSGSPFSVQMRTFSEVKGISSAGCGNENEKPESYLVVGPLLRPTCPTIPSYILSGSPRPPSLPVAMELFL